MALARAGAVLLAAVACAWFVLGVRQAHETDAATALVNAPKLTATEARSANAFLRRAATLNPDREPDVLRAQLALRQGQRRRALSIAQGVARREPQNINAWVVMAQAAYYLNDRATLRRAAVRIERLDPLGRE